MITPSATALLQAAASATSGAPPQGLGAWLVATLVKMLVVFTVYMVGVALLTLAERKISAWIQGRLGPNRVGPGGLLQPAADGLKNIMKEETYPAHAYKPLFVLAPAISFIPALITWAVIPFGAPWDSPWGRIDMALAPLPVGFLYILAISLELNGLVAAWHHRTDLPHGVVHASLRSACGGPPTAIASAEQLRERIERIREWAVSGHRL